MVGKYFGCRKCGDLAYEKQMRNTNGRFSIIGHFLDLGEEVEEGYQKNRIKFWKGKPTKKFARVLQKRKLESFYACLVLGDQRRKKLKKTKNKV